MSRPIRPEDLDVGVAFDVAALGTLPLGPTGNVDLAALQKPLRDLYFTYYKSTVPQALPPCRLVVSNKGLAVTDVPLDPYGGPRLPAAETLYNIPSVAFAAAVKFVIVGKKEKCAFDPIDPIVATSGKGKNDQYVALDKKWKHLSKVTSHPAICACVIQRMSGVKSSELHAFVCESDLVARDVIHGLTSASRNFAQAVGGQGQGVYDLSRAAGGFANGGGMDPVQQQQHQQQQYQQQQYQQQQYQQQYQQKAFSGDGAYDFHSSQGSGPQMAGYRGADLIQPGAVRPEMKESGTGWSEEMRAANGRPLQHNEGTGGWLNQQRDQLLRNFSEDQRKMDNQRNTPEQGIYDLQRAPYDQPTKGIYDLHPSKGVYDVQPPKGVYDTQQAIYEYRPPHVQPDPPRDYVPSQVTEGIYGVQRGLLDPAMGLRGPGFEPNYGNPYGGLRSAGSSERLFEEPLRSPYDQQPRRVNEPQREAATELRDPEGAKGFALPRVQVNYDNVTPTDYDLDPAFGGQRPLGYGPDVSKQPRPVSPYPSSRPEVQSSETATIDKKNKKVQPPPPSSKPRPNSATSPTSEAPSFGMRSVAPGTTDSSESHHQTPAPAPAAAAMVAPRKVTGIKVFPTIMLRGNQAQAAAAAAAATEDDEKTHSSSEAMDKQQVIRNNLRPDVTDDRTQDKSRKGLESELSGLKLETGRGSRNSGNDFEQTLGFYP